jgi:hypothetical protein
MRDDEQHWFNIVSEQVLYLHTRAAVTLFDELLSKVFGEKLADHLPTRVLPVSVDPPKDLTLLLDEEYKQIRSLLAPGRRARHEARARIRTPLALEAHVEPDTRVSRKDVDRVENGIKDRQTRKKVFPRLEDLTTQVDGEGLKITVHFSKKAGAPVRYVAGESAPAAAVREVDLQRKFHRSPAELATALSMTGPKATALRQHLGIDSDPNAMHEFVFGSQKHRRYSDNALRRMRETLDVVDVDDVWEGHKPVRRGKQVRVCTVHGCAGA